MPLQSSRRPREKGPAWDPEDDAIFLAWDGGKLRGLQKVIRGSHPRSREG